ncbi:MAG: sulfotransferase [Gammaproteobacteria bacterium]|nr:sulfotransferase [Gammaproteobacteria bacterium]
MNQVKFDKSLVNAPVFLLGMPRSGTTWLSQIYESSPQVLLRLSPNYSYPLKNMLDEQSSKDDWIKQLTAALDTDDPFMTHNWRREKGELEWIDKDPTVVRQLVIKDTRFHHLYLKGMNFFPDAKCLFVVRHPCGHLNSWRSSSEFPRGADFESNWRSGACRRDEGPGEYWGFDDWKALALEYLALEDAQPDRFKVFRYEDLVADPLGMTQALFQFVGLEFHDDVRSFLVRSHATHDPNVFSVFRSPKVADRWRGEFSVHIAEEIFRELQGTKLERFIRCA